MGKAVINSHLTCLVFLLQVISGLSVPDPMSKCGISLDDHYGGVLIDCTAVGVSSSDLLNFNNTEATTLILNQNTIYTLKNNSFKGLPKLRQLSVIRCVIKTLEIHAFVGIGQLQQLDLSGNRLQFGENSIPFHVFDFIPNLELLALNWNEYYTSTGPYSDYINIFNTLSNLTTLYIDSFTDLNIGDEFKKLNCLYNLYITCVHLRNVYNDSLKGLEFSSVKHLRLEEGIGIYYENFHTDVFSHLPDLDVLEVDHFYVGNGRIMAAMKGLQGKAIRTLTLDRINRAGSVLSSAYERYLDEYVSTDMTQYLANVCVSHFTWKHSHIAAIEVNSIVSGVWRKCLLSMDFSQNRIENGDMVEFYMMVFLKSLQEFTYSTSLIPKQTQLFWKRSVGMLNLKEEQYSKSSQSGTIQVWNKGWIHVSPLYKTSRSVSSSFSSSKMSSLPSTLPVTSSSTTSSLTTSSLSLRSTPKSSLYFTGLPPVNSTDQNLFPQKAVRIQLNGSDRPLSFHGAKFLFQFPKRFKGENLYYLPKSLKILRADNLYSFGFDDNVTVKSPNAMEELYLRHCFRPIYLNGRVRGLDNLKHIDLTGSQVKMRQDFFHNMPSLKRIVLRNTQIDPAFLQIHTNRLLKNNARLEYLDLSQNGLNSLPKATFLHNPNLRYLCLASNRFTRIPFDLRHTPNMEILDLRGNSFASLSKDERDAIDNHQSKISNFTILLHGNALICTCSTYGFVRWLSVTLVKFDYHGNYSCTEETGVNVFTATMSNADAQLRRCQGPFYLMLSLTIASALVAAYMSAFLYSRYKKLIISKVLRFVVPGFRILSRHDFVHDVFIGYANPDVMFVKDKLLPHLEGQWKLRTFVNHRDLRQDPLDMTRALQESWRCLLVMTSSYLHNSEMEHQVMIMKTATFFVSPANLNKVVLLVEESVQYDVPDYVLQVVDEDRIIVVPDLRSSLDNQSLETLRNRLLER